tara:strand:+ start:34 stop:324 length:291 start_codon:yes stop_codon:yes gene_type:complete
MKKFDADFKKNAVKLVIEEKLSIKQVSQDLGIGHSTLNMCLSDYRKGRLFKSDKELEKDLEIQKLRKENKVLRQEREILKKAMGIFSSMSKVSIEL